MSMLDICSMWMHQHVNSRVAMLAALKRTPGFLAKFLRIHILHQYHQWNDWFCLHLPLLLRCVLENFPRLHSVLRWYENTWDVSYCWYCFAGSVREDAGRCRWSCRVLGSSKQFVERTLLWLHVAAHEPCCSCSCTCHRESAQSCNTYNPHYILW